MSTLDELQAEIRDLRSEVARLREDAALFFTIHRDHDGAVVDTQLRCWLLQCEMVDLRERNSQESSGVIGVDDEGAYVSLFGGEKRQARAILRVADGSGSLELLGADLNPVVRIFEQDGQGNVAVLSPGNVPRAIMKGMPTAGAISVLDPEGSPRVALLHTDENQSSVNILRGTQLRASMRSGDAGTSIMTCGEEGKRGCTVSSGPFGNSLLLYNREDQPSLSVASTAAGNVISLGAAATPGKTSAAVLLSDLPGLGGQIALHNSEGQVCVDLTADADGGSVRVNAPDPTAHVHLHIDNGGGRIEATAADESNSAILAAHPTGGIVAVRGEKESAAIVHAGAPGGNFSILSGTNTPFFAGIGEETNDAVLMLNNREKNSVVQIFAAPEGGTVLLSGSDGTVQAGIAGSDAGGKLTVFSELGVERASLRSHDDGGGLHLKWGGTTALIAAATEHGGLVTAHGPDGQIVGTLPNSETFEGEEEE